MVRIRSIKYEIANKCEQKNVQKKQLCEISRLKNKAVFFFFYFGKQNLEAFFKDTFSSSS